MNEKIKSIDVHYDLVDAVKELSENETLVLEPGTYFIDRAILIDKTIVLKSATDDPNDVVVVRHGSTVLLVKDGAPSIENITFLSPSATSSELNSGDFEDDAAYQSCVAIRGGSPTFIGCRASSADQSGFSVRGEGVTTRLIRCEARKTTHGGIFFDGGATGSVENCLFVDNGLACVDVEKTPEGQWVEIRDSKLLRSRYSCVSVHNGGHVKLYNSDLQTYFSSTCVVEEDSSLEAFASIFHTPRHEPIVVNGKTFEYHGHGAVIMAENEERKGSATFKDCRFQDLVYVVCNSTRTFPVTLQNCSIEHCEESILFCDPNVPTVEPQDISPAPICIPMDSEESAEADCFTEDDPEQELESDNDGKTSVFDSSPAFSVSDALDEEENEFSDEEIEQAESLKDAYIEEILGKQDPVVLEPLVSYDLGGTLTGYFYSKSRYGGTFFVSKELVLPDFSGPQNRSFDAYELAMATRIPCPPDFDTDDLAPFESALFGEQDSGSYQQALAYMSNVLTSIALYIERMNVEINQGETLEFPQDFEDPQLAGRCFIFDELGTPRARTQKSWKQLLDSFSADLTELPSLEDDEQETDASEKLEDKAFGLLLAIELHRSEMEEARKIGGFNFIPDLKEQKVWPFSDLDRDPIV